MLGSRLARRIVFPVLVLIGGLCGALALVAGSVADARVEQELAETADRVAATIDGLGVAPEHRPEILSTLAGLLDVDVAVDGYATHPGWRSVEANAAVPEQVTLGGRGYRVLERRSARGPSRIHVLFEAGRVTQRRRDVLLPVLLTGAAGLLVAFVLGLAVARTIARPVRRLADSVEGFAAGRTDIDPGARGPGEIGDLQEAFSGMVCALREQEVRLRETERLAALGRLVAGVAHELRNPLTAIRMAVETAAVGDEQARDEARGVALAEIDRLDRTLRAMLDYVRPRRPVPGDVDVHALLEDVAALLRAQCGHLGVRLEVGAPPEGASLRGDHDRLKQALLNLVLNGAQAQPKGGVVRLRGDARTLVVEDEGSGIPVEVRASLLQPFVSTKVAGIGLGLAVVKQIADEHGAEVCFETGERGTTFVLRFPA